MDHKAVLLEQAVEALVIDPAGNYIDGTYGRGGHSRAVLAKLGDQGRLLALDKDPEAVMNAASLADDPRFEISAGSFTQMQALAAERGWQGAVHGVLLDLGVSSPQLDDAERGFSFLRDGPLDMRMNPGAGLSAAQWLAEEDEAEIARVFKDYGEERYAKRIARAVVRQRQLGNIDGTLQLAQLITDAHPKWEKHKHPATRCFQAIRIHINGELDELGEVLQQALELLAVGGRLVVISFHSLEDRVVKQFIRRQHQGDPVPASIPLRNDQIKRRMEPIGKAVKANQEELDANPRARSAVMRVAQKLA